ncbi:DEKNAAC102701 [Brettanomyces naardenensis]|uniref:DEKNAAC102701 n=1 Tax=Brettanomyces naardenensis TaxID=13370 RepID=A0A448YKJ6_BRENA|nr:DEKNAAC102701 [Brettanomyces naardenensis]
MAEETAEHHEVIVLGAGIAGLKCCEDLHVRDVDFIALEARDRFGGRIYTDRSGKASYEIGPSWAHDTLMNPLFDEIVDSDYDFDLYYDDDEPYYFGEKLEDGDFRSYRVLQVVEELKKYIELAYFQELGRKDVPLKEICLNYAFRQRKLLSPEQIIYAPQFLRLLELWHGISWEATSSKYALVDNVGRNCVLRNGYDQVINNIVKKLPPDRLFKNSVVSKIHYDAKNIELFTTDNHRYTCDYLVVTVPQSILQLEPEEQGGIKWEPELPERIETPLDRMSFGKLGKFVFEFAEPFWKHHDTDRFIAVANPDPSETETILGALKHNRVPTLPRIDEEQLPRPWDFPVLILNLYRVNGVPSLLCFTQGPLTEYLERNPAEAWNYMKPIISRLAKKPEDVLEPENVISSQWTLDPYSRGSYAACRPGDDPTDLVIQLTRGIGNVRFAGEHTILDGAGAVHGAWMSGKREAKYILIKTGRMKGEIDF